MKKRLLLALGLAVGLSATLGATFTALCGGGVSCAYIAGDKLGYRTVERIRTNFNDIQTRLLAVEGAYLSASSVHTLTNKTLNAESTGNVVTLPFHWFLLAATCEGGSPYNPGWNIKTAEAGTPICVEGSNVTYGAVEFPDNATPNLQNGFLLPSDWTGAIDLTLVWTSSATSGNVSFQLKTTCVAVGEAIDPAYNATQQITDAAQGTANRMNTATLTGVTTTGCAAGEMFYFMVTRDGTNGADTLGATANLLSVDFTYRRAM